jgi:hypothetical protein
MAFVGQTMNPWDIPVKQSLEVMQKIWDATSSFDYVITTDTAVYHKVSDQLVRRMMLIFIFQTVQRLADSWRNVIGSTGIVVLLAFLDSQEDLRDSDENRVKFAKYYREDLRFIFRDSDHDDKKACDSSQLMFLIIHTYLLEMEGSLLQPLHPPDLCSPS